MDFLVLYPKGRNMFIEFVPDKYIGWQPNTEAEIRSKLDEISPVITELRHYCKSRGLTQIIVIDCDKAVQFDRLNYVLLCKMVTLITRDLPDPDDILRRIEVRHCNPVIASIYNSSKVLLPRIVTDIFHVYNK